MKFLTHCSALISIILATEDPRLNALIEVLMQILNETISLHASINSSSIDQSLREFCIEEVSSLQLLTIGAIENLPNLSFEDNLTNVTDLQNKLQELKNLWEKLLAEFYGTSSELTFSFLHMFFKSSKIQVKKFYFLSISNSRSSYFVNQ